MEYALAFDNAPSSVQGGTGILLLHPSTVETDRVDTAFLKEDTDHLLAVSTRTTAREVRQKLDFYEVEVESATILDTLSVERGYTRRQREGVRYLSSPDDLDGMVGELRRFLETTDGKRRISIDSITEMIYYADEERVADAIDEMLDLLEEYDAVGLFHMADEVHDAETLDRFRGDFEGVIELTESGTMSSTFDT
jgi:KaiC/GvpD/RAD55 family RecA-like ATPase